MGWRDPDWVGEKTRKIRRETEMKRTGNKMRTMEDKMGKVCMRVGAVFA